MYWKILRIFNYTYIGYPFYINDVRSHQKLLEVYELNRSIMKKKTFVLCQTLSYSTQDREINNMESLYDRKDTCFVPCLKLMHSCPE